MRFWHNRCFADQGSHVALVRELENCKGRVLHENFEMTSIINKMAMTWQ